MSGTNNFVTVMVLNWIFLCKLLETVWQEFGCWIVKIWQFDKFDHLCMRVLSFWPPKVHFRSIARLFDFCLNAIYLTFKSIIIIVQFQGCKHNTCAMGFCFIRNKLGLNWSRIMKSGKWQTFYIKPDVFEIAKRFLISAERFLIPKSLVEDSKYSGHETIMDL